MLGLGNAITGGSPIEDKVLFSRSVIRSDDGFSGVDVEGNLTLSYNQEWSDAGADGLLKGEYDTTQTGYSGIKSTDILSGVFSSSSAINVKIKIGFDTPVEWGTDSVATRFKIGGTYNTQQVSPVPGDTIQQVDFNMVPGTPSAADFEIAWPNSGDLPAADAVFYIKDIVISLL